MALKSADLRGVRPARVESIYGGIVVKVYEPVEVGDLIAITGTDGAYLKGVKVDRDEVYQKVLVASHMSPGDGRKVRCVPWLVLPLDIAADKEYGEVLWFGKSGKVQLSRPVKGGRKAGWVLEPGVAYLEP